MSEEKVQLSTSQRGDTFGLLRSQTPGYQLFQNALAVRSFSGVKSQSTGGWLVVHVGDACR